MKKSAFALPLAAIALSPASAASDAPAGIGTTSTAIRPTYPETRRLDLVEEHFGVKVPDPYRWLEDDTSAETAAWVEAQNKVTFAYLDQIPYRAQLNKRLNALYNYAKYSSPSRRARVLAAATSEPESGSR